MGISHADYLSMQARLTRKVPDLMAPACDDEGKLHNEIMDECRKRGWIPLHGSMAHRALRTPGEWDFVIIADGGRTFLIECKSKKKKQSTEQKGLHLMASILGHKPHVVRSFEQFLSIVNA